MAQKMKTVVSHATYCHRSVNQSLGRMGETRAIASLHSTTSSSCTTFATTTHNMKYLAPYILVLALAEWVEGNKGLCREIAGNEAS
jgi:hypothetical protein